MVRTNVSSLDGRHAFVTGGSRGIGEVVAGALLEAGARVTITGRNAEAVAATAERLGARGACRGEVVEVTDAASIRRAAEAARAAFGPVTILVANAGQAESAPLHRTPDELWDRMIGVNLTGTFLTIRELLPDLLAAGWGRIVNVSSIAGLAGAPYITAYCAAKHGVIGLTRALGVELAKKNITVNAVCPGYTETDMLDFAVTKIVEKTGRSVEEARADLTKGNPQGRFVTPEEVANTVLWLVSPGSESITAQAIAISGGEIQ
ncbi:MAG: SDR family NAD(P)-dependent oxidoreductase [Thermoanaerobaculia bacterium]|nr:SDR family NAD(P)-dependent oxidoreductase [Thermoanaerobaculia bacterium]